MTHLDTEGCIDSRPMNPGIKARWVSALQSGDYKQGREVLRCGDHFCCLGVLTDLYRKECGGEWKESETARTYKFGWDVFHLPNTVRKWAGLEDRNPIAGGYVLANFNDSRGDFKEIAGLINDYL